MSDESYTTEAIGSATVTRLDRPAPSPTQPAVVSMYQARRALLNAGLLAATEAAIDALPEADRQATLIAWEFKTHVSRDSPLLRLLGTAIGLSDGQIDDLFAAAATIT